MIFDYTEPDQGIRAQKALVAAGVAAVLTPYKLLTRGGDEATVLVVHRVEVPGADCARARIVLHECGLLIRRSN